MAASEQGTDTCQYFQALQVRRLWVWLEHLLSFQRLAQLMLYGGVLLSYIFLKGEL